MISIGSSSIKPSPRPQIVMPGGIIATTSTATASTTTTTTPTTTAIKSTTPSSSNNNIKSGNNIVQKSSQSPAIRQTSVTSVGSLNTILIGGGIGSLHSGNVSKPTPTVVSSSGEGGGKPSKFLAYKSSLVRPSSASPATATSVPSSSSSNHRPLNRHPQNLLKPKCCDWCEDPARPTKYRLQQGNFIKNFCSEPCLHEYQQQHSLSPCSNCRKSITKGIAVSDGSESSNGSDGNGTSSVSSSINDNSGLRGFCSNSCLNQFRTKVKNIEKTQLLGSLSLRPTSSIVPSSSTTSTITSKLGTPQPSQQPPVAKSPSVASTASLSKLSLSPQKSPVYTPIRLLQPKDPTSNLIKPWTTTTKMSDKDGDNASTTSSPATIMKTSKSSTSSSTKERTSSPESSSTSSSAPSSPLKSSPEKKKFELPLPPEELNKIVNKSETTTASTPKSSSMSTSSLSSGSVGCNTEKGGSSITGGASGIGGARSKLNKSQNHYETYAIFDWDEYLSTLTEDERKVAPKNCFRQAHVPLKNEFEPGMKLEARDPRNPISSNCIATVIMKLGSRIQVRLDGTDNTNDFFELVDSANIHPIGTCQSKGEMLVAPMGFTRSHSQYDKFVFQTLQSGTHAPKSCFKSEPLLPSKNKFHVGMKLEAVDKKNPRLICPATVKEVRDDQILISFDGYMGFDYWVDYYSRDIFWVGWCKESGHPLQPPGPQAPTKPSKAKLMTMKGIVKPETPKDIDKKTALDKKTPSSSVKSESEFKASSSKSTNGVSSTKSRPESRSASPAVPSKSLTTAAVKPKQPTSTATPTTSAEPKVNGIIPGVVSPSTESIPKVVIKSTNGSLAAVTSSKGTPMTTITTTTSQATTTSTKKPPKPAVSVKSDGRTIPMTTEAVPLPSNPRPASATKQPVKRKPEVAVTQPSSHSTAAPIAKSTAPSTLPTPPPTKKVAPATPSSASTLVSPSSTTPPSSATMSSPQPSSSSSSPLPPLVSLIPPTGDPNQWKVEQVFAYVVGQDASLHNADTFKKFKDHEIDGKAFLLLTSDMMMKYMDMKLGPALKLQQMIDRLHLLNKPSSTGASGGRKS